MGANTKIEWANDTFNTHWGCTQLVRLGKKKAGRTIDGRTWDQLPNPRPSARDASPLEAVDHG